jgi:hypothetical protein
MDPEHRWLVLGYNCQSSIVGRCLKYPTNLSQLAQLLLAQVDFKSPGMYDSTASSGSLEEKIKAVRNALAIDFDLHSVPYYAEDDQCCDLLPSPQPEEAYMWANKMV